MSLISPDWIIEIGNNSRYGLMWQCLTLFDRKQVCFTPTLSNEWLIALILIFIAIICITTVVILLLFSRWSVNVNVIFYARWIGFGAMISFCLAAVIFPLGFNNESINGLAYQLPNNFNIGISYIFFILALWITVISELFAGKICLPHL